MKWCNDAIWCIVLPERREKWWDRMYPKGDARGDTSQLWWENRHGAIWCIRRSVTFDCSGRTGVVQSGASGSEFPLLIREATGWVRNGAL